MVFTFLGDSVIATKELFITQVSPRLFKFKQRLLYIEYVAQLFFPLSAILGHG